MTPRSWACSSASASDEPDPQHVAVGHRPGGLQLRQRAPAHELGDEEARPVLLAGVEDGDDPGVVEAGDGVGLAAGAVVGAAVGGDRLDRDGAPEALVARLVDRAEAAGADPRTQPVAPQGERRVGLSDELFGGLHGERSFAARRAPTFTPQRRLRAVAPPRRAYFTPCPSSTRTTSRAEVRARAEARRWATRPLTSRRCCCGASSPSVACSLLLVLLFFVVRSCANSRKENALKDYNREVASIVQESDTQVGAPFFELLGQAGDESPQDLQTNISGYRVQAEAQLKQATRARRAGGDEGRPAGAADGARVPPRRARLHRRAHPHRARGRGRGRQRRDHGDRRARCRRSWPPTCSTRRAPRR